MNLTNFFKSDQQIVAEIHNEFDTAQDKLLAEANRILSSENKNAKAELLLEIGFTSSPKALVEKQNKRILVKSKKEASLIRHYQDNYPFQKFLTEYELDRICEKYNLIYAPIANYIKDVPEKNLLEIKNSKNLLPEDKSKNYKVYYITNFWSRCPKQIKTLLNLGIPSDALDYGFNEESVMKYVKEDLGYNGPYAGNIFNDYIERTTVRTGLFIAAPKSHFNLQGLKKDKKFGFMDVTIKEYKDPIVFRYCRGGLQVLSKWGLEASDEILLNPINN